MKADTTFRPLDALALEANFTFFSKDSISDIQAVVGLNFNLKNDSTHSVTKKVNTSGLQKIYLKSTTESAFDNITGFIYCMAPDSIQGNVLVSGIRLMRYHDKEGSGTPVSDDPEVRTSERSVRSLEKVRPQHMQPAISR